MNDIQFKTTTTPDYQRLAVLLTADSAHPHIHTVDMPYRLTSTWQEFGCEVGLWEQAGQLVAWALFLPPWWNLDYVIHPSLRGTSLEFEIFSWGINQMQQYATRSGESFWGSVELFEKTPAAQATIAHLEQAGFQPFEWSTIRFSLDLAQEYAMPQLPDGFQIRPLHSISEVDAYVHMHRTAFNSNKMTKAWRLRTLEHPAYNPQLDLVVANEQDEPVGFCICWASGEHGQIEPLGVLPEYQGLGLGRVLELAGLATMQQHGVKTVHVDHTSFNETAVALSQQIGFIQTGNALRYYVDITS